MFVFLFYSADTENFLLFMVDTKDANFVHFTYNFPYYFQLIISTPLVSAHLRETKANFFFSNVLICVFLNCASLKFSLVYSSRKAHEHYCKNSRISQEASFLLLSQTSREASSLKSRNNNQS